MSVELITRYEPYVDEIFTTESKKSMLTNNDFDWVNAKTVKVYKISTAAMNDYNRTGADTGFSSRYGEIKSLDATTQEMTLTKDRSFTFALDKLDMDETGNALGAATALARQIREVVVPEVDKYTYGKMIADAGHKPIAIALTASNIYEQILLASEVLDNAEVPETNRNLVVTPTTYALMKKSEDIVLNTDIGADMRLKGVISNLDGVNIIKVPAIRLAANFGFMMCHPSATVAPTKLEEYKIHEEPQGISGHLVEGRINYDSFVLDNKVNAIYYQEISS